MKVIRPEYASIVQMLDRTRPTDSMEYGLFNPKVLLDQIDSLKKSLDFIQDDDEKKHVIKVMQSKETEYERQRKNAEERRLTGVTNTAEKDYTFKSKLDAAIAERIKESYYNGFITKDEMDSKLNTLV